MASPRKSWMKPTGSQDGRSCLACTNPMVRVKHDREKSILQDLNLRLWEQYLSINKAILWFWNVYLLYLQNAIRLHSELLSCRWPSIEIHVQNSQSPMPSKILQHYRKSHKLQKGMKSQTQESFPCHNKTQINTTESTAKFIVKSFLLSLLITASQIPWKALSNICYVSKIKQLKAVSLLFK